VHAPGLCAFERTESAGRAAIGGEVLSLEKLADEKLSRRGQGVSLLCSSATWWGPGRSAETRTCLEELFGPRDLPDHPVDLLGTGRALQSGHQALHEHAGDVVVVDAAGESHHAHRHQHGGELGRIEHLVLGLPRWRWPDERHDQAQQEESQMREGSL
jgi:hypothetical protein